MKPQLYNNHAIMSTEKNNGINDLSTMTASTTMTTKWLWINHLYPCFFVVEVNLFTCVLCILYNEMTLLLGVQLHTQPQNKK